MTSKQLLSCVAKSSIFTGAEFCWHPEPTIKLLICSVVPPTINYTKGLSFRLQLYYAASYVIEFIKKMSVQEKSQICTLRSIV